MMFLMVFDTMGQAVWGLCWINSTMWHFWGDLCFRITGLGAFITKVPEGGRNEAPN